MSIDSSLFTLIFFCLWNLICGFLCKLLTMIFYNIITIIVWYFSLFYVCQWDKGLESYTNRVQKTRMIRLRMFSVFYLCIWVFVAVDRINIISVFFLKFILLILPQLLRGRCLLQPFKGPSHKMVKHAQTIRRLNMCLPTCRSVLRTLSNI